MRTNSWRLLVSACVFETYGNNKRLQAVNAIELTKHHSASEYVSGKRVQLFRYSKVKARCRLEQQYSYVTDDDCTNGFSTGSVCSFSGTDLRYCKCSFTQIGVAVIPRCTWLPYVSGAITPNCGKIESTTSNFVCSNDSYENSTCSSAHGRYTCMCGLKLLGINEVKSCSWQDGTTTSTVASIAAETTASATTATLSLATTGSTPLATVSQTAAQISGLSTISRGSCGAIEVPENGSLECTAAHTCKLVCNPGYIPDAAEANGRGIANVRYCFVGTTEWSKAAFSRCIRFDSFCNFNLASIEADPGAIVHLSYSGHDNDPGLGRIYIAASCKNDGQVFSKIMHKCVRIRCQCKLRSSGYYCIKSRENADIGRCVDGIENGAIL